ncbi:hypothetical protein JS562_12930, partial [Agrobacterium sp. S2]|nr:hypothetical protein [Agrobacterium sp. S2]
FGFRLLNGQHWLTEAFVHPPADIARNGAAFNALRPARQTVTLRLWRRPTNIGFPKTMSWRMEIPRPLSFFPLHESRCCAKINQLQSVIGIDRINAKLSPRRIVEVKNSGNSKK